MLQEGAGPLFTRIHDHLFRRSLFDDHAAIHKDHVIRDLTGEADLMRHNHHRHAFTGELRHHGKHFADELRVER